jgi:transposase InsO family protein
MKRETSRGLAPVTVLCATFGLSTAAFYAAKKASESPDAREEKSRSPRREFATVEEILAAVRKVLAEFPSWGVRKVWSILRREHGLVVSRKRVWAVMSAHGLVLPKEREHHEAPPRGHVGVPEPNRRFATDGTFVWTTLDGWVSLVPTIDCGCRSILGMVVSKAQDATTWLRSLREALRAAFGSPAKVPRGLELRTDHGAQFMSAEAKKLATTWSLEHTSAPKGRPTGNSIVERVIRTLKEELLWTRDWADTDEVAEAVREWMERYNRRRPHQSLGWSTPAEYRASRLDPAPVAA